MKRVLPSKSWTNVKLGVKLVIFLEVGCFVGSYLMWRKMNRDQDFRFKVYQMSPAALDYFYKFGETLGNTSSRMSDYQAWGVQKE